MHCKIALHCHSTWSYDGKWALSSLAKLFSWAGYDAVMMTEHDTGFPEDRFAEFVEACASASTARCKIIPGIEYSSPENDIHMLVWGVGRFLGASRSVEHTLNDVAEAGGAAIFAHPIRRAAWTRFDDRWVPLLSGIEIWNRKADGLAPGTEALRLTAETGLPATVGQDFHILRHFYPLAMTGTLPDVTLPALVDALRAGRLQPMALGRPVLNADGAVASPVHGRLEALRVRVRDTVRGRRRR